MANYQDNTDPVVAVVIPCYCARSSILSVLSRIGSEVSKIYVVDDACPEETGNLVLDCGKDDRIEVLFSKTNKGVGGAVKIGYREALKSGADIILKIDADGQMDPSNIKKFVKPIVENQADYTKGNRFYSPESLRGMPFMRLVGNALLSLLTKISSGYWNLMDPTNGFTAIHAKVLAILPLEKISDSYYFESDMLFRLNTIRAVVTEIPMKANYHGEKSSLTIPYIIFEFFYKHCLRTLKRIFYNYYLRDFSLASVEILFGLILFFGGAIYGALSWYQNSQLGIATPSGTVMVSALPLLVGFQLLLSALNYDIASVPRQPIHKLL